MRVDLTFILLLKDSVEWQLGDAELVEGCQAG